MCQRKEGNGRCYSIFTLEYSDWSAVTEPDVIAVSASRQNQPADFPHEPEGQKIHIRGYLLQHSSQSEASFRVPVQCCIILIIFTSTQAFQIYTKALIINYE